MIDLIVVIHHYDITPCYKNVEKIIILILQIEHLRENVFPVGGQKCKGNKGSKRRVWVE